MEVTIPADKYHLQKGKHYYYKRKGQDWIFNGIFDGYTRRTGRRRRRTRRGKRHGAPRSGHLIFKRWMGHGPPYAPGTAPPAPVFTETGVIESIWTLNLPDDIISQISQYGGRRRYRRKRKTRRRRKTRRHKKNKKKK